MLAKCVPEPSLTGSQNQQNEPDDEARNRGYDRCPVGADLFWRAWRGWYVSGKAYSGQTKS